MILSGKVVAKAEGLTILHNLHGTLSLPSCKMRPP